LNPGRGIAPVRQHNILSGGRRTAGFVVEGSQRRRRR
jgi:hypothetical protein